MNLISYLMLLEFYETYYYVLIDSNNFFYFINYSSFFHTIN